MKFDIWVTGYYATGMEGIPAKAECIAKDVEGKTFQEAVENWYKSLPNAKSRYGELTISEGRVFLWALEAFDNEEDARKPFG